MTSRTNQLYCMMGMLLWLFPVTTRADLFVAPALYDCGPERILNSAGHSYIDDFDNDGDPDLAVPAWDGPLAHVAILLNNGDGTFQTAVQYDTNGVGIHVTGDDLDGDGCIDLAVAKNDGEVTVFLGNGDGTFQPDVEYACGSYSTWTAIGDLDNDGHPDLAVANRNGDDIYILLGNGDGSFQNAVSYMAGDGPYSIAIGDLNGNGVLDLAVANKYADTISLLFGNGDGTFLAHVDTATGEEPTAITMADLDGDGDQDLATANFDSRDRAISVLLGNGDGTLLPAVDYASIRGLIDIDGADIDGDGALDLVVGNYNDDTFSVLFGNGDGTFQGGVVYERGNGCSATSIDDMDGDGNPDIVVSNYRGGTVSIMRNKGDGTFWEAPKFSPPHSPDSVPYSIAVGDLDGDGIPDLVQGGTFIHGNGDSTFQGITHVYDASTSVIIDVDGDEHLDLIVSEDIYGSNGKLVILLSNGDGTFSFSAEYDTEDENPAPAAAGDLDADGHLDLVVPNQETNTVSLFPGNGDGTFQAPVSLEVMPSDWDALSAAVGDLDGDGHQDLVVTCYRETDDWDFLSVRRGHGDGTFEPYEYFYGSGVAHSMAIIDLDDDGNLDVVTAAYNPAASSPVGNVAVFMNSGQGQTLFEDAVHYFYLGSTYAIAVGDLNGDDIPDVVTAELTRDAVSVLFGDGDGTFPTYRSYGINGDWPVSAAIADLDDDGDLDLAVGSAGGSYDTPPYISVLENTTISEPRTVGADLTCVPSLGTLPFTTHMTAVLDNLHPDQTRRVAARIDVSIANGSIFPSWKAGWANIAAAGSFATDWNQSIPSLGTLIGENTFTLLAADVTPPPYNQPPFTPSGDTDSAVCTVTAMAP